MKKNNSNYNRFPSVKVPGEHKTWNGWKAIAGEILHQIVSRSPKKGIVVIETYHGVFVDAVCKEFSKLRIFDHVINFDSVFKSPSAIVKMTQDDVTNDEIFGYLSKLSLYAFLDTIKLKVVYNNVVQNDGITIIIGPGSSYAIKEPDLLVYMDMPRWEIQQRFRSDKIGNLGLKNHKERTSSKYKRAFFVDWRVCDKHKKSLFSSIKFFIDSTKQDLPIMIEANSYYSGIRECINRPFRLVPFFDPGPWGGQWMKNVIGLDKSQVNYAWCFDCVPEENSLLLLYNEFLFETPSVNLVYLFPIELLGDPVHARFGDEFPIRFDFLDTFDGGNLSLQVHPLTEYIQEHFGMHYTQDESYYILDAKEDATVYLGLKEDVRSNKMITALKEAQQLEEFDAEKYVSKWKVKKHDHILIPAGTIHCSGKNCMVLEISATPYIFTFKLWDWGRLGLDGRPRPINIERGEPNIIWDRTTSWCKDNLINRIARLAAGDGWIEEKTGLHEREFIETRRHWFSVKVLHETGKSVNVLNLVEGQEVIVESPDNTFESFIVHYAETFIIPANIQRYTIAPHGESLNSTCATIKAFVRH